LYVMSTKKRYAVNMNYPCFRHGWTNRYISGFYDTKDHGIYFHCLQICMSSSSDQYHTNTIHLACWRVFGTKISLCLPINMSVGN
jgi:hypothetical protein